MSDIFTQVSDSTLKGAAIGLLADAAASGCKQIANLRLAANVANAETITIAGEVFEIHQVNTDTTANTASGQFNTTAYIKLATIAAHGLTVGRIVRVESEYLRVEKVIDANTVALSRGYAGSTVAAHADAVDIFKGAAAPTAGNIPLPVGATLTPAAFSALAVTGLPALSRIDGLAATAVSANHVLLTAPASGGAIACAETLAGVDNTIDAAFYGGVLPGYTRAVSLTRVPTATEVTLGVMHFPVNFAVKYVKVYVNTTSSDAVVAWDGAVTWDGSLVSVGNGGTTDWSTATTVTVQVVG